MTARMRHRVTIVIGLAIAAASLAWMQPAIGVPVTLGPVNASLQAGNEDESAVAVNPADTDDVAMASNSGNGLRFAYSTNRGQTWTRRNVGTGAAGDGFPQACCDPSLSWDNQGNLFLAYLTRTFNDATQTSQTRTIELLVSTDGGATFTNAGQVDTSTTSAAPRLDQPTVVAAQNAAWVTWRDDTGRISVRGRSVNGATLGAYLATQDIAGSDGSNFGDIAISPTGAVMIAYQNPSGGQGPGNILVQVDADGLGAGGFGGAVTATATNIGGFDALPPQATRTVDAEAGLAWDRTGGANNGRVYLVYTDEAVDEGNDSNIFVRSSTDNGATWGAAVRVNDDAGARSQLLPKIALDQTNGDLYVSWYDARNDDGTGPNANDLDGTANNDVQFYSSFSSNAGGTWTANLRLSRGTTTGTVNGNQELGDYSGATFHNRVAYSSWADSSNSTGDNLNGTAALDVYVARVLRDNTPPTVTVAPASGNEGSAISASGTATDPDNDPLTYSWTATPAASNDPGSTCIVTNGTTLTPSFTCSDDGQYTISLTATGDPQGPVTASNTLTVANVAPTVTTDSGLTTTIAEGGTFAMGATFVDPGWNDTYTGTIDFGTGAGASSAAVAVTTQGPPNDSGTISGSFQYGDDGSFTVTASVSDDDGGSDSDTAAVTVTNVDPTATINESGTTTVNGIATILARAGDTVTFSGRSTDPGSDDLTLSWDFDDGFPAPDITTVYLVNPPNTDPDPSPSVQPRDVTDTHDYVFADACIYQVGFAAADDDGGSASDTVAVLMTGNQDAGRPSGYWSHQYRREGATDFDDATLTCYLEIVDFVSKVFHEIRNVSTFAAARSLLFTQGMFVTKRDQLDRDLLTAWLNFANGAVGWNELVDTNANGVPDTQFHVALETAEGVRLNPVATPAQFDAQRRILQSINDSI